MDLIEVHKVLSNKTRMEILRWLKNPEQEFPPHKELGHFNFGVCGQHIFEKSGLSQSTISNYLSQLQNVGLITPTRIGKWTYFQRNEENINSYLKEIAKEL
ncbi:ArsR family transcriptional regulator [Muricauda sp. 2012CJ35-5]|uniref:ArsR family transcriptional regulator n=1 Tax=Flagellimonas spongiicola TaxID=2942208 RepID=A0ABT0PU44_9FLAO|nr:helix-turn-helix transcriptional regulator [Allomuricauda spongiicola]MCL6274222.1 ArsR family transcriptional regulator [Allomuricauda spongiicola]